MSSLCQGNSFLPVLELFDRQGSFPPALGKFRVSSSDGSIVDGSVDALEPSGGILSGSSGVAWMWCLVSLKKAFRQSNQTEPKYAKDLEMLVVLYQLQH